THINTLFPEVRLKKTIEIRGADSQGAKMACALPALWTGIYYDEKALALADAFTADWTLEEVTAVRPQIWQKGLAATFRGAPLVKIAERIVEIAEGGLERRAHMGPDGKSDERIHLAPLKSLVSRGLTPAEQILEGLKGDARTDVMARADL